MVFFHILFMNINYKNKELLENIFSGVYDELLFGTVYGSHANDLDILLVYKDKPFYKTVLLGNIDCLALSIEEFELYLSLLDPVVTEPMFNENNVLGKETVYNKYKESIEQIIPSEKSISHLLIRSQQAIIDADNTLKMISNNRSSKLFRLFIKNFSWAISYHAFARYYSKNKTVINLENLIKVLDNDLLFFGDKIIKIEKNDLNICKKYLNEWSHFILRIS